MNTEVIDPALGGRVEVPAGETAQSGKEATPEMSGTEVSAAAAVEPAEPETALEGETASAETAPAETSVSAEEAAPAEEAVPSAEPAPVEEAALAEETTPAEETASEEEPAPAEEAASEEESAPAEGTAADQAAEAAAPAPVDYSGYSRPSLVTILEDLIEHQDADAIRHDVDAIKLQFYRKLRQEQETARKAFVEAGNDEASFALADDPYEGRLKQALQTFKAKRAQMNEAQEAEKQKNLAAKQAIIQELKELINGSESIGVTFQAFRDLQNRWRNIGPVPQSEVKNLWETYHHNVENFYDYIKINKELRDLDLKRNLEAKIKLCEKAEDLLLESSDVKAFNTLQQLHEQWREIGPVPQEMRVEIWERFKTASSTINRKYQQHFEDQKAQQQKNLEAKTALCEQAEAIAATSCASMAEWDAKSKEIIEIQKIWQTIGFATKKENTKIYNRFRAACDAFFTNKRAYFAQSKEEQTNNLQLKEDLCIQAEALKDSTEWKATTEEFIKLQQSWKEIGAVPRKHRDALWKRFRTACDAFFEKKSAHFSTVETSYDENYKAKMALIEQIEAFVPTEDMDENIARLQEFQRAWSGIGFVPMKVKAKVQERYRAAISAQFSALNLDEEKMGLVRYKSRMENLAGGARSHRKVETERDRLFKKMQQLQNDINVWENNIGFFSKTRNAEAMIANVRSMIEKGKADLKVLEEKIRMIDQMEES